VRSLSVVPGLDVVLRGLSMTQDDATVLALTGPMFEVPYDYFKRSLLLGREAPGWPLARRLAPATTAAVR
jgi:hypothetical protein